MDLVIYGAQGIALSAYEAIHDIFPQREVRCFAVTERGTNAGMLSGLPVLELADLAETLSDEEKDGTEILIATPENMMPEIEERLDDYGMRCHVRLTSSRMAQMSGYRCARDKRFLPLMALPVGYNRAGIHMFMAKFYKDKPLSSRHPVPEWVAPIQVGAALCEECVANILDSDGVNISEKNVNYSELTALYWIWKNRLERRALYKKDEYYGLSHYRRVLELSDDDILKLADNGVDAVLPYPMPYEPDIGEHHKRYLKPADWAALVKALEELQPEYAKKLPEILGQRYFYNYNIILAKKEVLTDYCAWLFPILERVEELSVPKGRDRADRYIGYMGETLETLYFMANKDRLCITHAGCRFLT